jgi:aminopeptidase
MSETFLESVERLELPMADPRISKLADVLVHYSIPVRKGDWFIISSTELAAPLIREVYRAAIEVGAFVELRIAVDGLQPIFYKHANEAQLTHVSEADKLIYDKVNSTLTINAPYNLKELTGVDPKKQAMYSKARAELSKKRMERAASGDLRWCLTLYPTHASAQEAGMSLGDYTNFVYGAMLLNHDDPVAAWKAQGRKQQKIADLLTETRELRIVGPGTDVTMSIAGRKWENADGTRNFPDGEVYSAPIEDSVNGVVTYSYPAIHGGHEVEDVRLVFEKGRVIQASARKGQAFLTEMLDMDAGSRTLGEIGVGTNYGIQHFTKNMLFDEKMGGTIHLALGMAYPETGGKNVSGLHWDMLIELRQGGEVFADGRLVMKDGKWLIE